MENEYFFFGTLNVELDFFIDWLPIIFINLGADFSYNNIVSFK